MRPNQNEFFPSLISGIPTISSRSVGPSIPGDGRASIGISVHVVKTMEFLERRSL